MSTEADTALLARRLQQQAENCAALGSPLYGHLLAAAAGDVGAGGPTLDVLRGHAGDPPGSALALRFMAALHRQVLTRRAPALALHYPSVGGTAGTRGAWDAARDLLSREGAQIAADVGLACQTNEVGRAAALLAGLLHVAARYPGKPLRLLEIGASAGLNLLVDRYRIGTFGPAGEPLLTDPWDGRPPPAVGYRLAARAGCDLAPIDAAGEAGRLTLSASVWADQPARFARLALALGVAAAHPVTVDRSPASDWLRAHLAERSPGVATVVWHSVVWQYLTAQEQSAVTAALEAAGRRADPGSPLVHLRFEPELRRRRVKVAVRARHWPSGSDVHVADGEGHGPPVRWRR